MRESWMEKRIRSFFSDDNFEVIVSLSNIFGYCDIHRILYLIPIRLEWVRNDDDKICLLVEILILQQEELIPILMQNQLYQLLSTTVVQKVHYYHLFRLLYFLYNNL